MEKELDNLKASLAVSGSGDLLDTAYNVADFKVISARLDDSDAKALRDSIDHLKDKLGSGVVVLGGVQDGKVRLAAGVTANLTARIKAGDLVSFVAQQVGGRGGGRPDFAQAGGSEPQALEEALASVEAWLAEK